MKTMHTPSKQQWQTVIDNFYKILPLTFDSGKRHLNMTEPAVNNMQHECGTVHCVAGWYAIATLDTENEELYFLDGAKQMAKDLGFAGNGYVSGKHQLEQWALHHPHIWGNRYGADLFYDKKAYGGAKSIEDVIHHLEGVHDRSPEVELILKTK